jgi:hypothetical protein
MFKSIAIQRGGMCLSTEYVNCSTLLQFKCEENHIFERTGSSINNGGWCIICSGTSQLSVGEKCSHNILEYIYKEQFYKMRHSWLVNNEGNAIELYCYSEKLAITLE